jgi:Ni/Co efflux regulator RcnB
MKGLSRIVAVSSLALFLAGGTAIAQDHPNDDHAQHHAYVRHHEWKKGYHIKTEDWSRGERVDDWHAHHLRKPPSGYEWREIDGNYVLANPDGVIFSVTVVPQ